MSKNYNILNGGIPSLSSAANIKNNAYIAPVCTKDVLSSATSVGTEEETEAALEAVAPFIYSYHTKYDKDEISKSTKAQQLFMAYDGIGVRRTEIFNGNKIIITTKTDNAPGLKRVPVGIEYEITNKIPFNILREIMASFKAIYARDKTESAAQVYRKKDGEYFAYYPVQSNSSANTNYSADVKAVADLRKDNTLVLEAHSHAGFSAFFSGGDNANEKAPLMYCVIGNQSSSRPSFVGRIKLLDQQALLNVEDIFDVPEGQDALSFENLPEPSAEMLANAKPVVYNYSGTSYKYQGARTYGNYAKNSQKYLTDYMRDYEALGYNDDAYGYCRGYGYEEQGNGFNERYLENYKRKLPKSVSRGADVKFDNKWLVDHMSNEKAAELLGLLTKKLEIEALKNKNKNNLEEVEDIKDTESLKDIQDIQDTEEPLEKTASVDTEIITREEMLKRIGGVTND